MRAKAANTFPENRLGVPIPESAVVLGVSQWNVKDLLRQGVLTARKIGRRTLIDADSLKTYWNSLPPARFAPPVDQKAARQRALEHA